jgi:hypothetical protein
MKWLVVLLACAGCKQHSEPAPAATTARPVIPVSEVKRGQDACKAYVAKVCACAETVPAMKHDCELSRSYPEAMQVSLDVAATADSTRLDVLQANDSVRKIVKQCIEATAKLPGAGCP